MIFNNKFFRFVNQNRNIIILVIVICAFIVLLIKTLNGFFSNPQVKNEDNQNNISNDVQKTKNSVISNSTLDNKTAQDNYDVLKKFVQLCNENNIEEAYNLLSDECKQNVYPNLEGFTQNYVNIVFKNKKNLEAKNWIEYEDYVTYLVTYTGDIISTGDANSEKFQDYITIDCESNKLNINKYIRRKQINKTTEKNNIKYTINYVDIYKDYEIYNVDVENKNNKEIVLDNLTSVSGTYIETSEDTKINCSNYEAGRNNFTYGPGISKNMKLKFIKQYNTDIEDKKIIFSTAILNEDNVEEIDLEL